MGSSYVIRGDLSEKQIEADVAHYLGWCTPQGDNVPLRLLDVNEQLSGADKQLLTHGVALFLQFKKSTGLERAKAVSRRKNKSKRQVVREYRKEHGLQDDPSLCFQLRQKSATASDFQHNVLMAHSNPPHSVAVYVAPLILWKEEYFRTLFESATRHDTVPFRLSRRLLAIHQRRWTSYFNMVPFLKEHICIPPHEHVDTHDHYYSYGVAGGDVAWHSGEILRRAPNRLSEVYAAAASALYQPDRGALPIRDLARLVTAQARDFGLELDRLDDPYEQLAIHGRWLGDTYGIRQLLLVGNPELLIGIAQ